MSALPPSQIRAMRAASRTETGTGSLAQRWRDLNETAARLAAIAELAPERGDEGAIGAFPGLAEGACEWQRELAFQALEDIEAMLRPGLAALSVLAERGQDARVPAQTLWRELHEARETMIAVVRPGEPGPH
ncbi:hypothetical protein [Qipengyuania nanhaisediminis]|uniref:hypothetical protein n=1 Tax=Qipengyuania nanhaisediminis TaxID=604088 RepID=UPI0038B3C862